MDRPYLYGDDMNALREARRLLQSRGMVIRIANTLGTPLEYVIDKKLPHWARAKIDSATKIAVDAACRAAIKTMKRGAIPLQARNGWHKLAVAATGAAGGFFGLAGAPIELPVTTTVMMRSIMDIARSHGEEIDSPATRIACLEVLALGGTSKKDEAADNAYFAVRAGLAQQVSAAVNHLATKGLNDRSAPALVTLMSRIATYFAIPVSEKLAAEAVPVIGAITGSGINTIFIGHFQRMAMGHFTVRALERKYGENVVREAYLAL